MEDTAVDHKAKVGTYSDVRGAGTEELSSGSPLQEGCRGLGTRETDSGDRRQAAGMGTRGQARTVVSCLPPAWRCAEMAEMKHGRTPGEGVGG